MDLTVHVSLPRCSSVFFSCRVPWCALIGIEAVLDIACATMSLRERGATRRRVSRESRDEMDGGEVDSSGKV